MYLALKTLHIIAVILLVGNAVIGAFWKAHGDRTGDPMIMAHTMDGIIRSGRIFTMPAVIALLVFGFAAAGVGHIPILHTGWIWVSLILFAISGALFGRGLVPLQVKARKLALDAMTSGNLDKTEYDRISARIRAIGTISLLALVGAVVLMVGKPSF